MNSQLHLFLLPALIASLGLIPAGRMTAQTFTFLHRSNGSEGSVPEGNLISSGNILYGTTPYGFGTVFAANTDGTGFTNLHRFTASSTNSSGAYTNNDGFDLRAALILSGNTLYGTAGYGGSSGLGTVFAVGIDGTGFKTLHTFAGYPSEGATSRAGLILSGTNLYGTTIAGGSTDGGTVFAVNTDGAGFTNLHSFTAGANNSSGYYTNSDGANPWAGLVVSGNTLYGTAVGGGSSGLGTVFAINTDGTGFATLHSFTAISGSAGYYHGTNSDGAYPWAGLILSSGTLFGTAAYGGSSGFGTVFAINTDGTGFTTLHSFTTTSDSGAYFGTNNDGAYPYVGLVLAGDTLYGRTPAGGSSGVGTIFAVNTNGTGFANVHNFAYNDDLFQAGLTLAGNTLYGTTIDYFTDVYDDTLFSLSFRPLLTVTLSGASVILSWPTNVAGFDYTGYTLQSTTNLVSPTFWAPVSPAPLVVNGQNTVTNSISGNSRFYRLIRPGPQTWETLANMPTARDSLGAAAGADGRIYAIGGEGLGGFFDTVEAYTPGTDSWITMPAIPTVRSFLAAATGADGRIYAIGGADGSIGPMTTVEVYTP